MAKTIIACRPGFLHQAQSAFSGMEIEVDATLDKDYEFRERELGLADLLEAELDGEERDAARKADPKNAHSFVVPLLTPDEDPEWDDAEHMSYLLIRVDNKSNYSDAQRVINDLKPVVEHDDAINIRATINALNNELQRADIKVYSISSVRGLTFLKPVF